MDIVFSEDPRDFARRDWSTLVTADPAGTFFHTPQYLKLYWEEFGHEPDHLLLAFAEDDGAQVGAVAFERVDETLRFLGGTEVTDYQGPVAFPEHQPTVAKELFAALERLDGWSDADLRGLPEDRAWLSLLAEAAGSQGFSVEIADEPNGVAPFLEVPGSYEEYLERLPSKLRHEIKRKARKLEAEIGPWHLCLATQHNLDEFLDTFVELHRTSEGPKGVFLQPGMEIFFRRLGEAFLPRGIFSLAFLELEGHHKLAGTIGFRFEGTYSLYNSAFDRAYQSVAPGMVLVAEDIRIAIESGCSVFDLLKGDYAYKYRFGAVPRMIKRLVVRP
ncbi:MAG TPA: GNAT family N-acetyltransferase [Actinomycetota bacterium]|nr:GNAT family N-acetyltransferase [Actinomycetota bacterium]